MLHSITPLQQQQQQQSSSSLTPVASAITATTTTTQQNAIGSLSSSSSSTSSTSSTSSSSNSTTSQNSSNNRQQQNLKFSSNLIQPISNNSTNSKIKNTNNASNKKEASSSLLSWQNFLVQEQLQHQLDIGKASANNIDDIKDDVFNANSINNSFASSLSLLNESLPTNNQDKHENSKKPLAISNHQAPGAGANSPLLSKSSTSTLSSISSSSSSSTSSASSFTTTSHLNNSQHSSSSSGGHNKTSNDTSVKVNRSSYSSTSSNSKSTRTSTNEEQANLFDLSADNDSTPTTPPSPLLLVSTGETNTETVVTKAIGRKMSSLSSRQSSSSVISSANTNATVSCVTGGSTIVSNNTSSPESYMKNIFSSSGSFRNSSVHSNNEANSSTTYKKQKENYLTEKKRITNDMLTIMRDERIIVLADWLKVRGSLKNWIKLYVILKPGIMLLFKSDKMKPGQWIGTILLNSCQLLERPSKKHGFCFKIFHPLERSIWASKGPSGETYINVPYMLLPTFYLIFRAPSEKIGNIWMEAIELTLKSSHLIKPPSLIKANSSNMSTANDVSSENSTSSYKSIATLSTTTTATTNSKPTIPNNEQQATLSQSTSQSPKASIENVNNSKASSYDSNHQVDETILSDNSDNYKTNSSDDLCSLNSSTNELNNLNEEDEDEDDDEFFDDTASDADKLKLINAKDEKTSKLVKKNSTIKTNEKRTASIKLTSKPNTKSNSLVKQIRHDSNDSNTNANNEQNSLLEKETCYVPSANEEFGELGNKDQTEEVGEENKSLIFCLVKQVRPGMDLSKVVLPTFILEPRSFLEKLTDYYYHSDILSEAVNNDDPYERMKTVVKFYLSGFYKKPKGLKKPYNPILGEVFRSYWYNPKTDSKTFYIAEQVSHHPPISAIYVTNRKEGFCIYGTILARSKFYGNSVSAIMEGNVKLILLNRGEEYVITLPYANCKGILIGKLTMELGGKINIECAKTGYSAEIDFKLKPLLGGIEASNLIEGKIKFAKETMAVLSGKWDGEILLNEKKINNEQHKPLVLWHPTKQVIESRLKRFVVPVESQMEFESEKLWLNVSKAITDQDQNLATEEKTKIELKQREKELTRRSKFIEYKSKFFTYDSISKEWLYNCSDLRPWDPQTDMFQVESEFKIFTKTKHNLKVKSLSVVSDPRSSLLSLHRHPTSHHHHHHLGHHHRIVTDVVDTNSNETYNYLVQYNEIKDRLDQIEDNLKNLTSKLEPPQMQFKQQNTAIDKLYNLMNDVNNTNRESSSVYDNSCANKKFLSSTSSVKSIELRSTTLTVALIAWFVGLLSAIFSQRLLSILK